MKNPKIESKNGTTTSNLKENASEENEGPIPKDLVEHFFNNYKGKDVNRAFLNPANYYIPRAVLKYPIYHPISCIWFILSGIIWVFLDEYGIYPGAKILWTWMCKALFSRAFWKSFFEFYFKNLQSPEQQPKKIKKTDPKPKMTCLQVPNCFKSLPIVKVMSKRDDMEKFLFFMVFQLSLEWIHCAGIVRGEVHGENYVRRIGEILFANVFQAKSHSKTAPKASLFKLPAGMASLFTTFKEFVLKNTKTKKSSKKETENSKEFISPAEKQVNLALLEFILDTLIEQNQESGILKGKVEKNSSFLQNSSNSEQIMLNVEIQSSILLSAAGHIFLAQEDDKKSAKNENNAFFAKKELDPTNFMMKRESFFVFFSLLDQYMASSLKNLGLVWKRYITETEPVQTSGIKFTISVNPSTNFVENYVQSVDLLETEKVQQNLSQKPSKLKLKVTKEAGEWISKDEIKKRNKNKAKNDLWNDLEDEQLAKGEASTSQLLSVPSSEEAIDGGTQTPKTPVVEGIWNGIVSEISEKVSHQDMFTRRGDNEVQLDELKKSMKTDQ